MSILTDGIGNQVRFSSSFGNEEMVNIKKYLVISCGDVNLPPTLRRFGHKDLQHPYFWSAFTMIGNPW
jgi:CHAT domain-containing protein